MDQSSIKPKNYKYADVVGREKMKSMRRNFFCLLMISMSGVSSFADSFDVKDAVIKCQKCHGETFDKSVLNVGKKISELSKEEMVQSFEQLLNAPDYGRKGLMKIILKKYTKEERDQIAHYIVKKTKK